MGLAFDDLSHRVIGAALEVHKRLGPGFVEGVYEQALKVELKNRSIPFESQKSITIFYDEQEVGKHVLDLFVDSKLVVELKAAKKLDDVHLAQVRSYLRAIGAQVGLLMNFNGITLDVRRVVNQFSCFLPFVFS